jgi:hypothetical protein
MALIICHSLPFDANNVRFGVVAKDLRLIDENAKSKN